MTGLVVFLAADAIGLAGFAALLPRFALFRGRDAVKAAAVLAASLAAYNFVSWRMGLGWAGQLAAFAVSAVILWAGRASVVPRYPAQVDREGEADG